MHTDLLARRKTWDPLREPLSKPFFFFKQRTAYEMRPGDWSSDVCSSDLFRKRKTGRGRRRSGPWNGGRSSASSSRSEERRVGKSVRSCVDLGGGRIIKKKKKKNNVRVFILICDKVSECK